MRALQLRCGGRDTRSILVRARAVSVNDVAELLQQGLGKDVGVELPGSYRAGDIRHCFADTTLARDLLGFEAKVRLEDGIRELVEWVRSQTASDRVDEAAAELSVRGLAR